MKIISETQWSQNLGNLLVLFHNDTDGKQKCLGWVRYGAQFQERDLKD